MWQREDVGSNRTPKNEMPALSADQAPFATPRPGRLLERVLQIATNAGDVVLDCFGGSGTTAAVAHKRGAAGSQSR
ncbi:MAG: DNA methyltransferase, partial [Geodermatophilaceae bacterium]